jgi:hypothetical protein
MLFPSHEMIKGVTETIQKVQNCCMWSTGVGNVVKEFRPAW